MNLNIFKVVVITTALIISKWGVAENKTDVSLFFKKQPYKQLQEVSELSGDLYKKLGHHGPAIENEYLALRMFFGKKSGIDLYSKSTPRLELATTGWYPTKEQQNHGWGGDYYHVGKTIGLGSIRLWDGTKVISLNPVSNRSARVVKHNNMSFLEMLSEDVPYKNTKVDILVRVTVYSGFRDAKVEAYALSDQEVKFVTGLTHEKGTRTYVQDNYIMTWGDSTGDVSAKKIQVGTALKYNSKDFQSKILEQEEQTLLISNSTKKLEYYITSANSQERVINSLERFSEYLK
ncbi:MAG: DUF4861 family protein [Colwellia sp.]|nr:DUF4861 family protein [Colwellia sp.]